MDQFFGDDSVFPADSVRTNSHANQDPTVAASSVTAFAPGVAATGVAIAISSPALSPRFPDLPLSAVSFSEYVQSELAIAQSPPANRAFPSVAAVTAALSSTRAHFPILDAPPSPTRASSARLEPKESFPRAETLPNLASHSHVGNSSDDGSSEEQIDNGSTPDSGMDEDAPADDSTDGSHSAHSAKSDPQGPTGGHVPSRTRWSTLDCLQLDNNGEITHRTLTRSEILQEARVGPPNVGLNFSNVAEILNRLPRPGSDAAAAAGAAFDAPSISPSPDARRATQRALRDYLRNSLQARDIRQVDPAFAAKPALWVRHSAIVVSLEGIRAIIFWNKMLMFDSRRAETKELASIAQKCVMSTPDEENPQPFEFNALEGILISLAVRLEREFDNLKPAIESYIHTLPSKLTTKMLEVLRRRKQQLNHFHSRANTIKTVLENLLDDDEEMASMYLTEKRVNKDVARPSEEHMEAETLLEAYLQVIDEHVNLATLLNDAIDDTEDLVMIHLDTLRNRLLSVELMLSVVSMTFTLGGVIAGVFGMNLPMPLFEKSTSLWFFLVVGAIFVVIVAASWMILTALKRKGLYSVY